MTNVDEVPARLRAMPSWLLGQVSLHAHRLIADALAAEGSTGYQYRLLAALEELGPSSQAALGRSVRVDRSDVVAALDDLEARAMIERSPDPADRRRNVVAITPAGASHLRCLDRRLRGVQDELLGALRPQERRDLTRLLARVLAGHDA